MSALCHCETVDVRACLLRSLLGVSLDVVCIPSTQWSEAQFLCACVCPNHSNNRTGLQHHHQQQQQCSFASVVPSPGTAAGKPCSCCCGGQDASHSSINTVDTSVRKCDDVFVDHINNEMVVTFPNRLVEGVAPCSGFECHVGTHIHSTIISTFSDRGI